MAVRWPSRTYPYASPVTITRPDGTVRTEPAKTSKQLAAIHDAESDFTPGNRTVTLAEPCPCGSTRFWDNRRHKHVGAHSPNAPDYRCTTCRQPRWTQKTP